MKKKIVKSKKRVPKFQDGVLFNKSMLDVDGTAAKKMDYMKKSLTVDPLKSTSINTGSDIVNNLISKPTVEAVVNTPKSATTPKSIAAKNSKTISDSYKKSLQKLMNNGKSIDELVKAGYGTKQGLTNLGLTAPKKSAAPKPTAPKKPTTTKPAATNPTTPKKAQGKKALKLDSKELNKKLAKSAEDTYRPNIVGDLIGGPLKAAAAAVGAGAGIYGLYKAGKFAKNLSNVGKAFTKSVATKAAKAGGSQVAANTARKVALAKSSKQFANKRALKVVKNLSKERAITQAAKKSFSNTTRLTKEKLGKEFAKNVTEKSAKNLSKNAVSKDIAKRTTKKDLAESFARKLDARKAKEAAKDASKKGAQKLLGPGQKMLSAPKGSGQLKFNFRKGGKVTKMKRNGKKC